LGVKSKVKRIRGEGLTYSDINSSEIWGGARMMLGVRNHNA